LDVPALISAAWSLSYEFAFYLSLPFLVKLLRMYSWKTRNRCLFWIMLASLHVGIILAFPAYIPKYQYYDGSLVRFNMFISGIIVVECLSHPTFVKALTTGPQRAL